MVVGPTPPAPNPNFLSPPQFSLPPPFLSPRLSSLLDQLHRFPRCYWKGRKDETFQNFATNHGCRFRYAGCAKLEIFCLEVPIEGNWSNSSLVISSTSKFASGAFDIAN